MVNLLESLYAVTAVALATVIYYVVRGRAGETAQLRFKGALWVSGLGLISCVSLYWLLSA